MATKDDERAESAREKGKRGAAGPGAEPAAAAASAAAKSLSDELREAQWEYCRAVQEAWAHTTRDIGRANAEIAAARQRITLDTQFHNTAAYRAWLRAMHETGATPDIHFREHHQTYQQAVAAAVKSGHNDWTESHKTYQDALTAAGEAYAHATREALKAYLSHLKAAWSGAELANIDVATIASLAEASGYAAQAAQAIRWRGQPSS